MPTEINIEQYDEYIKSVDWLQDTGLPVAITLTEILEPSEGKDAIIFPPTYAEEKGKKPSPFHPYQIDELGEKLTPQEAAKEGKETNNCQIDGVGSQANRIEAKFKDKPLSDLVPQIIVKLNEGVKVNLLDIGHRITDGAVRFSELQEEVTAAIKTLRDNANAEPLAKLAPTSLVLGFWDSRPNTTMYKFGRMLSSTIRATNVARVNRSAQFNPAFNAVDLGLADELPEDEIESPENSGKAVDGKHPMAKVGLLAVPAVNTHGGVRVFGQIVRRTQLNLVRLRALAVTNEGKIDKEKTLKLRRYILGLALVAVRVQTNYDLREGCLLRCMQSQSHLVYTNSQNQPFDWKTNDVLDFAVKAASEFGVGAGKEVAFDTTAARKGVEEAKKAAKEKTSKNKR
jgi:CRISPR-associated protein Csb1